MKNQIPIAMKIIQKKKKKVLNTIHSYLSFPALFQKNLK